jgi:nucleoside-diphosphate-sugar epimerase
MFVDCSRSQKELGFKPGSVAAALDRAVRWYEANGYVTARRARRIVHAAA